MSGSAASPSSPRIFVSHSHEDDEYCRAFVDELRRLCGERDAVWYDEHNLTSGELMREIQRQLHQRPIFVVIFTQASLRRSQWVADECTWAYQLYRAEPGRTILPVTGGPIERGDFIPDWLYLEGFRRIEAPGMQPYPPAEAARRTYAALTGAQPAIAVSEPSIDACGMSVAPEQATQKPRIRIGLDGKIHFAEDIRPSPRVHIGSDGKIRIRD